MFGTIKMLINGNIIGMGGSIGNGLLQLVCVPDGTVHGVCGSDLHHRSGLGHEQRGTQNRRENSSSRNSRTGGSTCRVMKNQFARHFLQVEYAPETTAEMVDKLGVGALRKAAVEGDTKEGCFMAGQIAGMVKKEQPAAEIVQEIAAEAEALLKGAAKWVK